MKFGSRRAHGSKNEDEPCQYGDEIGVRDRGEDGKISRRVEVVEACTEPYEQSGL